ncbi:PIN-like domain-containing protein [Nocardia beijingensis]|uniref:PIN-like domain-containing protein n=1 Tax=Nocardia beijingensis TaxID=95162 RepID=A0ABW7WCD0_9NOCA
MEDREPLLMRQYRAWIAPAPNPEDSERKLFFNDALVVLDTNVLLDLYEYTPETREQVFAALERISALLWLPYQVGLEFVRGRHAVVHRHSKALREAPDQINRKFMDAVKSVMEAAELVQRMLQTYTRDDPAQKQLEAEMSQQVVQAHFKEWKDLLLGHAKKLRESQDLTVGALGAEDTILEKVAALFGTRIGGRPSPDVVRQRVENAFSYRFPNQIPPGFSDRDKGTPLGAAGDYLLWEEVIEKVASLPEPRRVLLVSGDTKEDWYQPSEPGMKSRPWPSLTDEIRQRAKAEIRIEQPQDFFDGIRRYLHADITDETTEEIKRAAISSEEGRVSDVVVTEPEAAVLDPPVGLRIASYQAAGLTTSAMRRAVESPNFRLFQWWLIGATVELARRAPEDDEPLVEVLAAVRSVSPPGPHWLPGTVLYEGEWPYRSSTWIAPWFAHLVRTAPEADRLVLQRLAARQADSHDVG